MESLLSTIKDDEDPSLYLLYFAPLLERSKGRNEAGIVAQRVLDHIPSSARTEVKIACAIEALEREDYKSWPKNWILSGHIEVLLESLGNSSPITDPNRLQMQRYFGLYRKNPHLLRKAMHGLTPKLYMSDRQSFVTQLLLAGRRQLPRGDEEYAMNEEGVVHIAMSYKHADRFDKTGTIDLETAEEMYETVVRMPLVRRSGVVRVWIDQNLHRYEHDGEWYEHGLLPYSLMRVASVFHKHGGFKICRRRPWLWVETGIAISALGIHCATMTAENLREVVEYPHDSLLSYDSASSNCWIHGTERNVEESIRQALINVSLWTPDMLEFSGYEYVEEFQQFCQWAKAQIVRLTSKGTFDLNSDIFWNSPLENVAWLRSLPSSQSNRAFLLSPYLRLEIDSAKCSKLVALLQTSGACEERSGIIIVRSCTSRDETFCFRVEGSVTYLNVNPPADIGQPFVDNPFGSSVSDEDMNAFHNWQGGFSPWDPRCAGLRPPVIVCCGRIFSKHLEHRDKLGSEPKCIEVGDVRLRSQSFMIYGIALERVYLSADADSDIVIAESDVLCLRELNRDMQREFMEGIAGKRGIESVNRILHTAADVLGASVTKYTLGACSDEILLVIETRKERSSLRDGEIIIRRGKLNNDIIVLSVLDSLWGYAVYSFKTTAQDEVVDTDLIGFRTGGDIDSTISKVRLMMGSDEYKAFSREGLSLGIGEMNGSAGKYPHLFRLEGSEFQICLQCLCFFSPVNGKTAVLYTSWDGRMISVRWGPMHLCRSSGQYCGITGLAF